VPSGGIQAATVQCVDFREGLAFFAFILAVFFGGLFSIRRRTSSNCPLSVFIWFDFTPWPFVRPSVISAAFVERSIYL
jgi:hypothetical protein